MSVSVFCACECSGQRPEDIIESLDIGDVDSCKLPNVVLETELRSSERASALSHLAISLFPDMFQATVVFRAWTLIFHDLYKQILIKHPEVLQSMLCMFKQTANQNVSHMLAARFSSKVSDVSCTNCT